MNLHSVPQRIEHWPIDRLIPYTRNPRTHSDDQVAQIAASITEFGFNNPILTDSKAGLRTTSQLEFEPCCSARIRVNSNA